MNAFHYAFKVTDIESTRKFYIEILGCEEGRSTETWIDFNFFGHQLSAHISRQIPAADYCGVVDGVSVPIPHFGCIVSTDQFNFIHDKLKLAQIDFLIKPQVRYEGKVSEQQTMFVFDFSGNPIEFKCFKNEEAIFEK